MLFFLLSPHCCHRRCCHSCGHNSATTTAKPEDIKVVAASIVVAVDAAALSVVCSAFVTQFIVDCFCSIAVRTTNSLLAINALPIKSM